MPFSLPKCATRAVNHKSPFGSPKKWIPNQLPTVKDVGAFYLLKRSEMECSWSQVPSMRDVCKEVWFQCLSMKFI